MSTGNTATSEMIKAIPNVLSLSRLLLAIIFPFVSSWWRLAVVVIAGFTDWADGKISRLLNAKTRTGIVLDAFADKIFVLAVVLTLIFENKVLWWQAIFIAARDIIVFLGYSAVAFHYGWKTSEQMKPRLLGKLTTVLQFLFLCIVIMEIKGTLLPSVVLTGSVSLIAGIDYIAAYRKVGREAEHSPES